MFSFVSDELFDKIFHFSEIHKYALSSDELIHVLSRWDWKNGIMGLKNGIMGLKPQPTFHSTALETFYKVNLKNAWPPSQGLKSDI